MGHLDEQTIQNLYKKTIDAHSVKNTNEYEYMLIHKDEPVSICLQYNGAGFWSIFNKLMNYLLYYKNIQKIEFNVTYPSNQQITFYGKENFFNGIFEPYTTPTNNTLLPIQAINYITYEATGCYANWLHVSDIPWRKTYNELFTKYIKIKPNIIEDLDAKYLIPKEKKIISILIRHPALAHEQINGRMPSFSQYDNVLKSLLEKYNHNCSIILATDLIEAEEYFKSKYSNYEIIHPFSLKTSIHSSEAQSVYNGDINLAKIAVQTVLLLSKADDFIFPNSNMATAVLYINPSLTPHFLIG